MTQAGSRPSAMDSLPVMPSDLQDLERWRRILVLFVSLAHSQLPTRRSARLQAMGSTAGHRRGLVVEVAPNVVDAIAVALPRPPHVITDIMESDVPVFDPFSDERRTSLMHAHADLQGPTQVDSDDEHLLLRKLDSPLDVEPMPPLVPSPPSEVIRALEEDLFSHPRASRRVVPPKGHPSQCPRTSCTLEVPAISVHVPSNPSKFRGSRTNCVGQFPGCPQLSASDGVVESVSTHAFSARVRKRGRPRPDGNAVRAERLTMMGELSAAHQVQESAGVAPGDMNTLNALRKPARRPTVPREQPLSNMMTVTLGQVVRPRRRHILPQFEECQRSCAESIGHDLRTSVCWSLKETPGCCARFFLRGVTSHPQHCKFSDWVVSQR